LLIIFQLGLDCIRLDWIVLGGGTSSTLSTMATFHHQTTSAVEVFVVGSASIDLVTYSPTLPLPGVRKLLLVTCLLKIIWFMLTCDAQETVFGSAFERHFGGKGANQAVQCAQLGVQVGMCSRVGSDPWGAEYIENMQSQHIDTTHFSRGVNNTGIASIFVAESGANSIVIVPGSNNEVLANAVATAEDCIENAMVLVCQNEIPVAGTIAALQLARKHNTLSILNPAPASEHVLPLIDLCDIVCPNETELSSLTHMKADAIEEVLAAGRRLLEQAPNCKLVLVTLGERGALIISRSELLHLPTERVTAIDTVGAGDSFIGSLVRSSRCRSHKAV
jgi:ribokinase